MGELLSNPSKAPWGIKAFTHYLSSQPSSKSDSPPAEWLEHDSSHLLSVTKVAPGSLHILVDAGTGDDFYKKGQIEPKVLEQAAVTSKREKGEVEVRMQDGFDHSYYFVSGLRNRDWVDELMSADLDV